MANLEIKFETLTIDLSTIVYVFFLPARINMNFFSIKLPLGKSNLTLTSNYVLFEYTEAGYLFQAGSS